MIETDEFRVGMALLAGAYGREIDAAVGRMYYAVLSRELTTEEFAAAVEATVRTETFWPSPAVILAKAGRRGTAAASAALAEVIDRLRSHGGYRFFPHAEFQAFDEPTRAAIRAVGGLREISLVEADRMAALERKFAAGYVEALATRPDLPAGPRSAHQLVGAIETDGEVRPQ